MNWIAFNSDLSHSASQMIEMTLLLMRRSTVNLVELVGSKLTLTELKAKTRCHQCKQVGHWSRECPHRSKHASPTSRSSGSTTGVSTGFFAQPAATTLTGGGSFLTTTPELKKSEEYMPAAVLSFCYLAVHEDEGTALVDTAAQRGLVGLETLQRHDHLLQERFGPE